MRYKVREKVFAIGTDFWVTDEHDNRAFLIDGKVLHIRQTLDIKDTSGVVLATVRHKLMTVGETFEIERDGSKVGTVHKVLISPLHHRYVIDLADGAQLEAVGNIADKDFEIRYGGQPLARVSRAWLALRDTYGIDVPDGQDDVLMIAIAVCIDRIHHDEVEKHRDR
jgi:uncharacterized protein YxjI